MFVPDCSVAAWQHSLYVTDTHFVHAETSSDSLWSMRFLLVTTRVWLDETDGPVRHKNSANNNNNNCIKQHDVLFLRDGTKLIEMRTLSVYVVCEICRVYVLN
jgi:hypothetical protein